MGHVPLGIYLAQVGATTMTPAESVFISGGGWGGHRVSAETGQARVWIPVFAFIPLKTS